MHRHSYTACLMAIMAVYKLQSVILSSRCTNLYKVIASISMSCIVVWISQLINFCITSNSYCNVEKVKPTFSQQSLFSLETAAQLLQGWGAMVGYILEVFCLLKSFWGLCGPWHIHPHGCPHIQTKLPWWHHTSLTPPHVYWNFHPIIHSLYHIHFDPHKKPSHHFPPASYTINKSHSAWVNSVKGLF